MTKLSNLDALSNGVLNKSHKEKVSAAVNGQQCAERCGQGHIAAETDRIGAESPHLRNALTTAVKNDNLDVVKNLLSLGVNPGGSFGQFLERFDEHQLMGESTLIAIALKNLSGKVACYLLSEDDLVPDTHLSDSLLTKCLNRLVVGGPDVDTKANEKAEHRLKILRLLCHRGIFPRNSAAPQNSTMNLFLLTLEFCQIKNDPKALFRDVPVAVEVLRLLCEFGGDVVTPFERERGTLGANEDFPPLWLTEFVENIKNDENVMNSLLSNTDVAIKSSSISNGISRLWSSGS